LWFTRIWEPSATIAPTPTNDILCQIIFFIF